MKPKRSGKRFSPRRSGIEIRVERVPNREAWRLLHPRCALERKEDFDEVQSMIQHGEKEIAVDELRWLLSGCPDCIEIHRQLGELAMEDRDVKLARGHFGQGFNAGLKAIRAAGSPRPLPFDEPANQDFFACGKGLAWCLVQLEKRDMARDVIEHLLQCDTADPLELRQLLR